MEWGSCAPGGSTVTSDVLWGLGDAGMCGCSTTKERLGKKKEDTPCCLSMFGLSRHRMACKKPYVLKRQPSLWSD